MTKSTQGKWSVNMSCTHIWIDAGEFTISQVIGGELSLPDAHLIAAAPVMYAMLEMLVNGDSINDHSIERECIEILKKARGE